MLKKITALLLAATMLLCFCSCKKEKGEDINKADNTEINPLPVMATENYEVTVSMMTYFFNASYRSFLSNNQSNLTAIGLDPTKSLSEQQYSEDYTWQDYFVLYVSDNLKQYMLLAEDAKANGFELSEENKADIEEEIRKLDDLAAESETTTTYIIQSNYGECVNEATIRKCLELSRLSMLYTSSLTAEYSFSDEEINEYYSENSKELLSFNYIRYQIETEDREAVTADFSKCSTEEDFVDMIKKYASQSVYDADNEYMETLLDNCYVYGAAYSENSDFANWAFDSERKAYDVYINDSENGKILVAMALPASEEAVSEVLWRDITPLHNIKSILFSEDEYSNAADAKRKAEDVLAEINAGASFDEKLSEYEGGSTDNMIRGNAPDEIEEWVFDESRKESEIGIVTVDGTGTYLIQMQKDGAIAWQYYALDGLTENRFAEHLEELRESIELQLNNDAVSQITPITLS